jgi:cysteine desulfurase family protein (TIGR01976 family)
MGPRSRPVGTVAGPWCTMDAMTPEPAAPYDLAAVRGRFPALARTGPDGRVFVHADAPGGTQVPAEVIAAMTAYLESSNANTHGAFLTSHETDALCDRARERVAAFLGGDAQGVVFGANMTTLTWHLSHALDARLQPGDRIVCTRLDHDANVSPWLALAARTGAEVAFVPLRPDGTLDTDALDELVTTRTRLVAFPLASNALGTVVDPAPFVSAARRVGALTFTDAVHAAPHLPIDRAALGVDVLVASPYKFYGPHAGVLLADPELLASLRPDKVRPAPDSGPERWQTGTAAFEAIAGTAAAVDHIMGVGHGRGMAAIARHESGLTRRFLDGLTALDHVTLHGPPTPDGRTPTFAVTVAGHTPAEVSHALAARGIFTWAGHYYAVEPMRALGLLDRGGAVRIGFVHYHGDDDVDRVLQALSELDGPG